LLEILADPESIFIKGLAKFERRTLYTNIVNDRSAVYYTTGISKTDVRLFLLSICCFDARAGSLRTVLSYYIDKEIAMACETALRLPAPTAALQKVQC
jgi:hypothetical protein